MDEKKWLMEDAKSYLDALNERLTNTKDAAIVADIGAEITSVTEGYNTAKADFEAAQKAFNTTAKQLMDIDVAREARLQAQAKQDVFDQAEADVAWYERRISDIKLRLEDFSDFTGDMGEGKLPVCQPDMYLDEKGIPQSTAGYNVGMDEMAGMEGFEGPGTGF
jgi:hypothetical protein